MAETSSVEDTDNIKDANNYFWHKKHEKSAFNILFPGKDYETWTLREVRLLAQDKAAALEEADRKKVFHYLKESVSSREKYRSRFKFAPLQQQRGHDIWVQLIQDIVNLTDPDAAAQPPEELEDIFSDAAAKQTVEFEDTNISANGATFLRFLEDIELCVAQAEALWQCVKEKKMLISTASTLTNTYLCTVNCMVGAEMILNPSWFENDCITEQTSGGDSTYWTELQERDKDIETIFEKAVLPIWKSEMPFSYGPLLTQMLTKLKIISGPRTIFNTPFIVVIAASLARRCEERCKELCLTMDELRTFVKTQILSTEVFLKKHAEIYKTGNNFEPVLSLMESVKKWADMCEDAVSFGQIMGWVKSQHVLCVRLFIHDSSILQLFTYICECIKIKGKSLPPTLETFFNDQRVSPFLYLDGRPKTLEDCQRGIKRWSDPKGMLSNLQITQHIFEKRNMATLTSDLIENRGRMTHKMAKRLNNSSLSGYLDWELEPPDPTAIEATVIKVVIGIMEKYSNNTESKSTYDIWVYLRYRILYNPEKENLLLSEFTKEYAGKTINTTAKAI